MVKELDKDLLDYSVRLLDPEALHNKDLVIQSIKEIVEEFHSRKGSVVRWKQILKELQEVESNIQALLTTIEQSSKVTISRMEWYPAFSPKFSELVPILKYFRKIARSKAEELDEELKKIKLDGKRSSYPEPDHEMMEFVRDGLRVFDTYQPEKASTTIGGPFRTFLGVAYELATGQKEVDFERRVKGAIREWRKTKSQILAHPSTEEVIAEMSKHRGKPKG